jgi:hypothetical protein
MNVDTIKDALLDEVIKTPDTADALNEARTAMNAKIEKQLEKLEWWGVGTSLWNYDSTTWSGVVKDGSKPNDNFQVHLCKWSDIVDMASPARLKYKSGIRKVKDSGGKVGGSRQQYPEDNGLSRLCNSYLFQLFRAEDAPLAGMAGLLDNLERDYQTHRAVVSVDFYYSRPLTQLGLHKDTTGNTLFVGLHYNNDERIAGPEYLYDFWPKTKTSERYHAPWSRDDTVDSAYWPQDLVSGLERARGRLELTFGEKRDLLYDTVMSQNGLVTFVDELIFHVTPLTRKRTETEKTSGDSLFRAVNINSITYEIDSLLQNDSKKLRRTFSTKDVENVKGTSQNGRRSFIRFWVMIEPKAWHE